MNHTIGRNTAGILLLGVVLSGAFVGCGTYRAVEKCGFAGCPGDAQVTAAVRAQLDRYPELKPPNLVYVQTLDRVVYLSGEVATDLQRETAASAARQAQGVARVVDNIALSYSGR